MNKIEDIEYIDVNNVSDNQDTYNYLMSKIQEIIDTINHMNGVKDEQKELEVKK